MAKKGKGKKADIPPGWKTAEEIAVDTDRSVPTVVGIANDENIQSVNYPGHRRRRYSPADVARIKAIIGARDRRNSPHDAPDDQD